MSRTEMIREDDRFKATLNLLEDFSEEKAKLGFLQKATMNLLDDFEGERVKFRQVQLATLNLLEDMNTERNRFADIQRALMNMLDDIEIERAKVAQARLNLESANKELEAFSYSVSHDLQAPLRAIGGFSQALVEDCAPQLNDEGRRYLKLIQDNAHNMGRLIRDLLAFARLNLQTLDQEEITMAELAQDVFAELQIEGRKVQFRVGSLPPARGDRAMLRQVFVNLLSNALKFTRDRDPAVIEVGYRQEPGEDPCYYVRDNGAGFDMQFTSKLFGVFQRLHSVEEFEGTGVGLALVRRIVTRHGGRVWAEGSVNQGACFYFTLSEGEKNDRKTSH